MTAGSSEIVTILKIKTENLSKNHETKHVFV